MRQKESRSALDLFNDGFDRGEVLTKRLVSCADYEKK